MSETCPQGWEIPHRCPPRPSAPDVDTDTGALRDSRHPQQCPRCGNWCVYDGWDHVHGDGMGIGSCAMPALRDLIAERDQAVAAVERVREVAEDYAFLGAALHNVPKAETFAEAAADLRRALDGDR